MNMTNDHQTHFDKELSGAAGQFATFRVGDLYFGIEVMRVQEVLRFQPITRVPLATSVIEGLINLRGQIVTAIDLRRRLGLAKSETGNCPMNIVVRSQDGPVSLLVDEIGDVLNVDPQSWEKAPPTLTKEQAEMVEGVFKLEGHLLLLLNTERVLGESGGAQATSDDELARRKEN
jgi:purine-binding chemotaxis protein CheW